MNAGRGSPYLNLSVCVLIFPTLPRSPLSLLCVSISPASSVLSVSSLSSCIFIFPLICLSILLPWVCIYVSISPHTDFSLPPFLFLHLCPHRPSCSLFPRSWHVSPPSFLSASPTPPVSACIHSPRMSPHSSLPKPKGTLVLNLDGLRCGEKLYSQRLRQPPGWSFTPPPPPLSTFPTCCMPGVGGRGMPTARG